MSQAVLGLYQWHCQGPFQDWTVSWSPLCQGLFQDIIFHGGQRVKDRTKISWLMKSNVSLDRLKISSLSCLTYVAMTVWRKLVSPMSQWPFEDIMSHQCCNDHMKLSCLTNVTMAVWRYHVSPMSPWPFEDVMTQTVWCVKDQCKLALAYIKGPMSQGRSKISCLI